MKMFLVILIIIFKIPQIIGKDVVPHVVMYAFWKETITILKGTLMIIHLIHLIAGSKTICLPMGGTVGL